jgi:hypothetical protein
MIEVEKVVRVTRNITDVFNQLFEANQSIFDSLMQLKHWNRGEWLLRNKVKQRKEDVYIYIPDMPQDLVKYTIENDKYVNISVKNKIVTDIPGCQKIKTKFKIQNVNPILKTILNDFHIINIKNVVELRSIETDLTEIKIRIVVSLKIPRTKVIEQFIAQLANNLVDNAVTSLTTYQL